MEDPSTYARTAFIETLQRQGISVSATPVKANPSAPLPANPTYTDDTKVAAFTSVPFAQHGFWSTSPSSDAHPKKSRRAL
ncbi:MAG: hypothetical protein M3256_21720 [Actinomycetota bacterium]|nr:hypothetical protein [Actinomycetota bacterium]